MQNENEVVVGAFQGYFLESQHERIHKIIEVVKRADFKGVDILCFPECYLTGYYEDRQAAWENSLSLDSAEFFRLCDLLSQFKTTVILGLNERCGDDLFNTAVVIDAGKYLGKYRKSYFYIEGDYCTPGREYPVFQKKGVNFGVIICIDSRYFEPTRILALKGAQLIFCPMFNKVPKGYTFPPDTQPYLSHFVARSYENHAWLISADILWEDDGNSLCPGFSRIYNNEGIEVKKGQPYKEELITYAMSISGLANRKTKRIYGASDVFSILAEEYKLNFK